MKINFKGFLVVCLVFIVLFSQGIEGFRVQNFNSNISLQNEAPTSTIVPPGAVPAVAQSIPQVTIEHKEKSVITPAVAESGNNANTALGEAASPAPAHNKSSKKHSPLKSMSKFGKLACVEYCGSIGAKSSITSLPDPSKSKKKKSATVLGVICVCEGGSERIQSSEEEHKEETEKQITNPPSAPSDNLATIKQDQPSTQPVAKVENPAAVGAQQIVQAKDSKSTSASLRQQPIVPAK